MTSPAESYGDVFVLLQMIRNGCLTLGYFTLPNDVVSNTLTSNHSVFILLIT